MNKNKKELYEENKKLKEALKTYSNFWETDAIEECVKEKKNTITIIYITTIVFLIFSAFLIGLAW